MTAMVMTACTGQKAEKVKLLRIISIMSWISLLIFRYCVIRFRDLNPFL